MLRRRRCIARCASAFRRFFCQMLLNISSLPFYLASHFRYIVFFGDISSSHTRNDYLHSHIFSLS